MDTRSGTSISSQRPANEDTNTGARLSGAPRRSIKVPYKACLRDRLEAASSLPPLRSPS